MAPLDPKTAKRLDIADPEKAVAVGIAKINYGPKAGGDSYLIFDNTGNLQPINLAKLRAEQIGRALFEILQADGGAYSRRELEKAPEGKSIADELGKTFAGFRRRIDLPPAIEFLLNKGLLVERPESSGKRLRWRLNLGENGHGHNGQ